MAKKLAAILMSLMVAPAAYAACTTHTYFIDGKVIVCTTCCTGGYCTTTCV
jgi:hypothetical protein